MFGGFTFIVGIYVGSCPDKNITRLHLYEPEASDPVSRGHCSTRLPNYRLKLIKAGMIRAALLSTKDSDKRDIPSNIGLSLDASRDSNAPS